MVNQWMKIGSIVIMAFLLSHCSAMKRFQSKLDSQEPKSPTKSAPIQPTVTEPLSEETTTPAENIAPPKKSRKSYQSLDEQVAELSERYEILLQTYQQQERYIQALQLQEKKEQETLRQQEEKWMTNFQLLEQSSKEAIAQANQETRRLRQTIKQLQKQLEHSGSRKESRAPEAKRTLAAAEEEILYQKQEELPPTPVPPPPKQKIIDDSKTAKRKAAKSNTVAVALAQDLKPGEDYSDPDVEGPQEVRELKRHDGVKNLYNQGMAALIQQDYQKAIDHFQRLYKKFPNDVDSDNAQFWVGHAYMKLKRWKDAETAFRNVLRFYEHKPTEEGYKTPDAIYMLGLLYKMQNFPVKAGYYFRQVSKRFPLSAAAKRAHDE